MTLHARAQAYSQAFPDYPPLCVTDRWLYGIWEIGNNYRAKHSYYGEYPPSFLPRVASLFPDVWGPQMLHCFAGALDRTVCGVRIDLNPALQPTVAADAHTLPFMDGSFQLTLADPPYSTSDAARYNTPMVNRHRVMNELARVTAAGGWLVWLDTVLPMFRKREWRRCGAIGMVRSTNHRFRLVSIFQRMPLDAAKES